MLCYVNVTQAKWGKGGDKGSSAGLVSHGLHRLTRNNSLWESTPKE